ncbi:hypothetical protein HCK00_01030 [Streptomyces sp. PLAI1-29]|uniref:Transporter n=1 Tax=Streptomyces zingiberis TaxID=2053010 RepID=A0ABX1BWX0_9ACTN|nr:hypothetical protein [Streptomyces zingiberis]
MLLVPAAALAGLLATASPAAAHAALTGSSPGQGAVVDSAPERVTLTFSESVTLSGGSGSPGSPGSSVQVFDPRGGRADTGRAPLPSDGGTRYDVPLRPGPAEGTYTVSWRAVSADGHPISGAFTYSVGAPSETSAAPVARPPGGGTVDALYAAARWAAYTGFVVLVGAGAFALYCRPGGAAPAALRWLVTRGWALLTVSTFALLLLRGPYAGGGGIAAAWDPAVLRETLTTRSGTALLARLPLLAAAALWTAALFAAPRGTAGERRTSALPGRRGLAAGGAAVATALATTWAAAEHATTGPQPWLAIPLDVLHLLAVACWLGGLSALLLTLRREPAVAGAAVRRFSTLALGSVVVLAATGLYLSWRQVGSWDALVSTAYGRLLLVKVGLVALLLVIARRSRRATGRLADAVDGAAGGGGPAVAAGPPRGPARGGPESGPRRDDGSGGDRQEHAGEEPGRERNVPGVSSVPDGTPPRPVEPAGAAEPGTPAGSVSVAAPAGPATPPERGTPTGPVPGGGRPSAGALPDRVRAAQLARQRAARAAASTRRAREADPVRSRLRRSVLAETAVAVLLLSVTTALTGTEPARAEQEAARAAAGSPAAPGAGRPARLELPFDTGGPGGRGTARLDLPRREGGCGNGLRLRLTDPAGAALDAAEVKLSFTLPGRDLGPLPAQLRKRAAGRWTADCFRFPLTGDWQAALTVRTSDIDQVTETGNVKIDR